jgi:hypothetical protein
VELFYNANSGTLDTITEGVLKEHMGLLYFLLPWRRGQVRRRLKPSSRRWTPSKFPHTEAMERKMISYMSPQTHEWSAVGELHEDPRPQQTLPFTHGDGRVLNSDGPAQRPILRQQLNAMAIWNGFRATFIQFMYKLKLQHAVTEVPS